MATLTKDSKGRSPYWICCYTAADGRRLKKSTKEEDRTRATEICLALERAEGLAARGTLTEARARDLIGEVLERTTGETLPFYTAEAWLREWLRGKEVSKSANTHLKYEHTIDSFIEHLGGRAKLNLAAITPKDISTFRDAQIASGKNPNTVRYLVKQLRIPFNAARRHGILTSNPAEAVELPSTKAKDGGESARGVFTAEQVEKLISAAMQRDNGKPVFAAGEDWSRAIPFAYFTGARLQDVANMSWREIDLPSRTITYRARKTGKAVTIPMHPELEAILLAMPSGDNEKAPLFPLLAGKGTGGKSGLSMQFSRIMERAKIEGEVLHTPKKDSEGRTVRSLSFHSLRHSFNSAMANAGVSQEIRMKLTGHLSADMNKAYTHHELEPLRAAVSVIPGLKPPKK